VTQTAAVSVRRALGAAASLGEWPIVDVFVMTLNTCIRLVRFRLLVFWSCSDVGDVESGGAVW
jgi:hypothetical protein